MFQRLLALVLLILLLPLFGLFYILITFTSKGPFIFRQKRLGKNKNPFTIYKIRTMIHNADELKNTYLHLNEADGPVFKITNDPRYTTIGKILSKLGLDELPQLINIIKGEMAFVGPRPLPVSEAIMIPHQYQKRFTVLPGITSSWVINGSHHLSFIEWMELDLKYIEDKSLHYDVLIALNTIKVIIKNLFIQ